MEIFEMVFNDNGVIKTIELEHEPVGYDAIDYNLNQDDDRYGRVQSSVTRLIWRKLSQVLLENLIKIPLHGFLLVTLSSKNRIS